MSPATSARSSIPTVRGPIDSDRLGTVLTHEHLFVRDLEFHRNYPALWDSSAGVALAVRQLEEAYASGVRTIVDMTVLGQGRDLDLISQVARQTRVNIVLATGLYALDGLPQIIRYRGPGAPLDGPDPIVDLLESDIRDGIAGSGVRAALLKFACEKPEPDSTVRRVAAAVAEVHARTGVPVAVHTDPVAMNGLAILETLASLGVSPRQVVMAHAGDSDDLGYLRALADTGAYIGCDRFGMAALGSDEQRVATVASLVRDGRTDQLLLSHDCASFLDHVTPEQRGMLYPQWNFIHLHARVLPALNAAGVDEKEVTTMLEHNPKRLLVSTAAAQ